MSTIRAHNMLTHNSNKQSAFCFNGKTFFKEIKVDPMKNDVLERNFYRNSTKDEIELKTI